jgi:hypothetical protein
MLILVLRNTHVMMPPRRLGRCFTFVSILIKSDTDAAKSGFAAFDPCQLFDEELFIGTLVPSL